MTSAFHAGPAGNVRRRAGASFVGILFLCAVCIGAGVLIGYHLKDWLSSRRSSYPALCTRVLDTDTIEVAWVWGTNKVRLVGLDAPESKDNKKLHDQAKLLRVDAGQLLSISGVITRQMESGLVGRNVNLIFPRVKIERDAFSRLLAYVEVDGKDIGAMLLRNGLVYPRPEPHPRQATYQALNSEARENRKGIYGLQR